MKNLFLVLFLSIAAAGCSNIEFRNIQNDQVVTGRFNDTTKQITVTLPDGNVFKGTLYHSPDARFSLASNTSDKEDTVALPDNKRKAYALLTSENSILTMELIVTDFDSMWTIPGYGEARTTDGRTYNVKFLSLL